jgi:hypothetical protein
VSIISALPLGQVVGYYDSVVFLQMSWLLLLAWLLVWIETSSRTEEMRDAGWEPQQLLPACPTMERQRNVPKEKESEPTYFQEKRSDFFCCCCCGNYCGVKGLAKCRGLETKGVGDDISIFLCRVNKAEHLH